MINNFKSQHLRFMWIVIPIIMFSLFEYCLKTQTIKKPFFFDDAINAAKFPQKKPDSIIIGSSRVAAAIDSGVFENSFEKITGYKTKTINAGMGYSTQFIFYVGIRNMLKINSKSLENVEVLIEAPSGMAVYELAYQEPFHPQRSDLLLTMMRKSDLPLFWSTKLDLNEKCIFTWDYLTRNIHFFSMGRSYVAENLVKLKSKFSNSCINIFSLDQKGKTLNDLNLLSKEGGTRTDEEGILMARKLAINIKKSQDLGIQQPLPNWDKSMVYEIIELVHGAGGRVVFFEMPMHSIMTEPLKTSVGLKDKELFEEMAKTKGCPIIKPVISITDEDLPDYWHLALNKRASFSNALADAYSKQAKIKGLAISLHSIQN
jgi:hypothetical protein